MGQYKGSVLTITSTGPTYKHVKLTEVDYSTNAEVTGDESGALHDEQLSLTNYAPVAQMTTKAIATMLDLIPLIGVCVSSTDTLIGADVITRALETCKEVFTSSSHIKHAVTTGLLRLLRINAPRNQDATLSFVLDTFTDGTNAPVAVTDGVSLPTPIEDERFRLGLCKLAGVQFPEIEGMSIDFGVSITEKSPKFASIWPDSAGVDMIRPSITFTGRDLGQVKTGLIELGATAATHANTTIQLVKMVHGGSYVSAVTEEHIVITAAGLVVPEMLVSSSGAGNATNAIRIPLYHDGTNLPIVIDSSAAYTASP